MESLQLIDVSPIEAIRLRMPIGTIETGELPKSDEEEHLPTARRIQNQVDYFLFRQYGPIEYNTYITYKDSDDYHMKQGQHTLSAEIDTPLGVVNVDLTAEYLYTGSMRRFDSDMRWMNARFKFKNMEDSCYEITITDPELDEEPYNRKEDFEAYLGRQEKRRAERLPSIEELRLFEEVLPAVRDAIGKIYPYSSDVLKQTHPGTKVTVERWSGPNEVIIK